MSRCLLTFLLLATAVHAEEGGWVRQEDAQIWGRTDGVVFGLPASGGMRGPRGLIRVGIWNRQTGKPELINFIAIEPVTEGPGPRFKRMAFSELEPSQLDAPLKGKRLWAAPSAGEQLTVRIEVERFAANQAHVYVEARMRSDKPDEIEFSVYHHEDSPKIQELTLTATMGNYERLRQLRLKDQVVESRTLYADYKGDGFVERENYPLAQMMRTSGGDAIVACATDEADPAAADPGYPWWRYRSVKLTQYWRVPAKDIQPDLRVRVNGRRVYWNSHLVVPGGIAFENFEVRQRYVPGQRFVFGLTNHDLSQVQ